MVKSPIVARINALLAEQGISKQEFYKACGITSAAYSLWNTGKTKPLMKNLEIIAAYLGVKVTDLLPDCIEPPESNDKRAKKDPATDGGEITIDDVKAAIWETNDPKKLMEFSRIINEKMQELLK